MIFNELCIFWTKVLMIGLNAEFYFTTIFVTFLAVRIK